MHALGLADFHSRVAAGERPRGAVAVEFKFADVGPMQSRVVPFVFSDDSTDAYNDRIDAAGWSWDAKAGVPALFGHDPSQVANVIGRGRNIRVSGRQLIGDVHFAAADENPNAEIVYRLVKGGYLNSVSVGFQPREWAISKDKNRPGGLDFKKQRLLEISVVGVPANENAIALARAAGIAVERIGWGTADALSADEIERVRQLLGKNERHADDDYAQRLDQVRRLNDLELISLARSSC
jgi:HK97 family phage prohead protease